MIDRKEEPHLIRDMKKRQCLRFVRLALVLGAGLAAYVAATPSRAIDVLPHQAVYDMRLGKANGDGGVASVQGTLLLVWEDACDDWVISQRLFLRITRDDVSFTTSSAFDTRESKDGLDFSFEDTTVREPGGAEYAVGAARLIGLGDEGSLVLEEPQAGQYVLPRGTVFPTAQMLDVLVRAEQGERFMSHLVYDGTDGATLFDATTVVGEPKEATVEAAAGENVVIWPMRVAYYRHDATDPLPDVEIGVDVQANGIARRIVFDYGTFTVESKLTSIETLPAPECPGP
jgi:hypothetical protein